jgi:hypothetical protein
MQMSAELADLSASIDAKWTALKSSLRQRKPKSNVSTSF